MKLICSSSSRKTSPHLMHQTPSRKKNYTPFQFKKGKTQKTKDSIVPRVFLHILVYIYCLCILELKLMLENFLEITTTRLVNMNFPPWQLFLKTIPQKCCSQNLGNYTDNTDSTYTYFGNYTDGTEQHCIYVHYTL